MLLIVGGEREAREAGEVRTEALLELAVLRLPHLCRTCRRSHEDMELQTNVTRGGRVSPTPTQHVRFWDAAGSHKKDNTRQVAGQLRLVV